MPVIILLTSGLYALLVALLHRHLLRLFGQPAGPLQGEPMVSVIIAIRNEAPHLIDCLESLAALDYPREKLEILLIDDGSSDGSSTLLGRFRDSHPWMQAIRLERDEKELPGKAGAVYRGIKSCRGEIIAMTDADCRVPPGWIRHLLAAFDENVGLVGGFTFLESSSKENGRFEAVQALDWLFLLGVAAAAVHMGKPLSWMGNNMAFRRRAYEQVGGYPALGHCLIEDFALLNAISRRTGWRVRITAASETAVISLPVNSLSALYQQRRRWALGIRQVRPFGKLLMVTSFLAHLGVAAALFCCLPAALAALALLLAGDLAVCRKMTRATGKTALLRHFPAFEFFYFSYNLFLPLLILLDRRIRWKDQSFPAHGKQSRGQV